MDEKGISSAEKVKDSKINENNYGEVSMVECWILMND